MKPGRQFSISLFEPVDGARDKYNVPTKAPPKEHKIHATRRTYLGREIQLADGTIISETSKTIFTTRYFPGVSTTWKVIGDDGTRYEIQGTRNMKFDTKHMLEIFALEVTS